MRSIERAIVCMAVACCLLVPARAAEQEGKKDGSTPKSGAARGTPKKAAAKKGAEKAAEKKRAPEDDADGESEPAPDGEEAKPGPAADPDEEYVKAHIKEFLDGTVTFDDKGKATIAYDFRSKKEEYQDDFLPPISPKVPASFRWSNYEEDHTIDNEPGIRVSDRGVALFKVWFADDLEATVEYQQGNSWSKAQCMAIVFQTKAGQAIGNNFGGQCARFANGAFQGGVPPATETASAQDVVKIGLRVRDGEFEASKNGKPKNKPAKYPAKALASGRVGFIWGGKLAGTICSLTITGKVDWAATAKAMKGN